MRTIVHLDADAFFASVEQAADTRLRGKPMSKSKTTELSRQVVWQHKQRGLGLCSKCGAKCDKKSDSQKNYFECSRCRAKASARYATKARSGFCLKCGVKTDLKPGKAKPDVFCHVCREKFKAWYRQHKASGGGS